MQFNTGICKNVMHTFKTIIIEIINTLGISFDLKSNLLNNIKKHKTAVRTVEKQSNTNCN